MVQKPNAAPWPVALNQILRYSPFRITKFCAMAHNTKPNPALWPTAQKSSQIFTVWFHSFRAVAHSA
jgi:hypothetical protein